VNGTGNARLHHYRLLLLTVVLALAGCTATPVLPTAVPTESASPPPAVRPQATATALQPTSTAAVPTATAVPTTPVPPTATAVPTTPVPPTATPTETVVTPPIAITEFTAAPAEIAPGDSVTLSWQASAEWATIYLADERGRLTEPSFEVPISGTLVVTTSSTLRNQADFFLFAGAGNVYEQATVSVALPCPDRWFFPDPPAGCPLALHFPTTVAQHFENALLLWLQATGDDRPFNEIIALYDDDGPLPLWQLMVDDWTEGQPESDPDIVPPEGFYQPVRGFRRLSVQLGQLCLLLRHRARGNSLRPLRQRVRLGCLDRRRAGPLSCRRSAQVTRPSAGDSREDVSGTDDARPADGIANVASTASMDDANGWIARTTGMT